MTSNKEVRAARKSYDLSTSAKWATLSSGNHNVQIVAKASGYRDSEKSAAVTVKKEYPNVTLKAGTYQFKENPVLPTEELRGTMAFKTKHYGATDYREFTEIKANSTGIDYNNSTTGASSPVYYNSQWATSTSQRVIIVENDAQVPSDFLTWFENSTYVPLTAGSYQFITDVSLSNVPSNIYVPFTSDGVTYSQINFSSGLRYVSASTTTPVYSATNGWVDQKYRIIIVTADTFIYRAQYTWFIANTNPCIEAGTYKFIDNPVLSTLGNIPLIFSSNGVSYNGGLNINGSTGLARGITYIISFDDSIKVYNGSTWTNQAYREITLSTSQSVPADFYKWAITDGNLVKQVEPTTEYKVTVSNIPLGTSPLEDLIVKQSNNVPTEAGSEGTELGMVALNQTTTFTITQKYVIICNIYGDSVESYSSNLVNVDVGLPNTDVFEVLGDGTIEAHGYYCLTGDTLITLADYTQKRLDELTLKDKVLSYNPTTQKLEADEITYTDNMVHKTFTEYDIWKFSDETVVKTVRRHRFYNVENQAMVYMDEWNIGEHAINKDGELIALVSHENVKEEVKHYTLFTKNQNYFANSLLSGNRYTKPIHLAVGKQVNETQRT